MQGPGGGQKWTRLRRREKRKSPNGKTAIAPTKKQATTILGHSTVKGRRHGEHRGVEFE